VELVGVTSLIPLRGSLPKHKEVRRYRVGFLFLFKACKQRLRFVQQQKSRALGGRGLLFLWSWWD
jgi:hypothetical protein